MYRLIRYHTGDRGKQGTCIQSCLRTKQTARASMRHETKRIRRDLGALITRKRDTPDRTETTFGTFAIAFYIERD